MAERIMLKITLELLSDTIFGSGFSIPGGEDIAVCRDERGYPYVRGSTIKGLLRDSLANLIAWVNGDQNEVDVLLGKEGWVGMADERRITVTPLQIQNPPKSAESCYSERAFTKLENGVVASKTLRIAKCICRGLKFSGELTCDQEDEALIKDALAGIKWAGMLRNRGFGQVRVTAEYSAVKKTRASVRNTYCLRYVLHTDSPVLSTNLSLSQDNNYETYGYIPGGSVRGMVIGSIAHRVPDYFEKNKDELLSDRVRFLDAVPKMDNYTTLPSLKGFYETKAENGEIESVVVSDGNVESGKKRARLGSFCTLSGDTIHYWSARTDSIGRIRRDAKDKQIFMTRYLCAGQKLEGYICIDNPALTEEIARSFEGELRFGADRYEGFGKCSVIDMAGEAEPRWISEYPYVPAETLYMLAISPFTMLNADGEPCGIDKKKLAEKLGVDTERFEIKACSTSIATFGSYNRTWQCREQQMIMYDRGSVFKLVCPDNAPKKEKIADLQRAGLGIRRGEGFGQILFLTQECFEKLKKKEKLDKGKVNVESSAADFRRARCEWIMKHAEFYGSGLSRSQAGNVQTLCENAIAKGGNTKLLEDFFQNQAERGEAHASRFTKIKELVDNVLKDPLQMTLGVPTECDDIKERLHLLVDLFDYSRKGKPKMEEEK